MYSAMFYNPTTYFVTLKMDRITTEQFVNNKTENEYYEIDKNT